ncbi:MAG: hypothetical protein OES57_19090, partial [Acidimicrobiia bacterium]|nr:hypothetical protein [Acidimicrobiia bacterium]
MKTQTTIPGSLVTCLAILLLVGAWAVPTAAAQAPTDSLSCAQASTVSAIVVVDNPAEAPVTAPLVREETAALVLADLAHLGAGPVDVEVAVARMGQGFTVTTPWTPLDETTYAATVAAISAIEPTGRSSLAGAIEGAQQELADRVSEGGCGVVVTMPIGDMPFAADDAGELCASGGTIDSLRSLPASLGVIATPTAVAAVDRALLDAVAGATGSEESCGSIPAEGAVIVGETRAELLKPAGRLIDDFAQVPVSADETDVCLVFACDEGSTTIEATGATEAVRIEGSFAAFDYDVIVESPTGAKVTFRAAENGTVTTGEGHTVRALWPSAATVSISIEGDDLTGEWSAIVVDTTATASAPAQWQRSVVNTVVPVITSVSPAQAGAEVLIEVELTTISGQVVDATTLPGVVPQADLVDPVTGTRTPVEFGDVIDGAFIGTVTVPGDIGQNAEISVTVDGSQPVVEPIDVDPASAAPPPQADGSGAGLLSMRTLALLGLAVVAAALAVWLVRRRQPQSETEVRHGSFEVVIGPDDHISRVIDDKVHPLFFRGPDFDPLSGTPATAAIEGLAVSHHRAWNPLAPPTSRVQSQHGPVVGSGGQLEIGDALVGVIAADMARSWAFVLDVDATAHANQFET